MKTSEAIRKLNKAGCYFIEHGGEHDCWYSPITQKRFRIPRHPSQELAPGTKRNIEKYRVLHFNFLIIKKIKQYEESKSNNRMW